MMMRRLQIGGLILALLSACGAPAASPVGTDAAPSVAPPTLAPTAAPTATPAPTSTATLAPSATAVPSATPVLEALFQAEPNLRGLGKAGPWDELYHDPGGIVFHAGQFHMFYNGINGWPRPVGVGYATSEDGINWTLAAQTPVFHLGDLSAVGAYNSGPNQFVTSALVEADGAWVLYYYTLVGGTFSGRQAIGRATAPAPTGPWTPDPEPVLAPGPQGAWDSVQVTSANVLKTEAGYVMYYEGYDGRNAAMIGLATSPDGRRWTKHDDPATTDPQFAESDPVLRPDAAGWDKARVLDPNVVRTAAGWAMVYLSTGGVQKFARPPFALGYATSPDGVQWTKSALNPIISSANHPAWQGVYLVTLLAVEDRQYLYFDVASALGTKITLFTHTGPLE